MKQRKIIPYNPKLKTLAKQLRQNMTFAEVLLWNHLKQKKMCGYDFDRQRPIDEYVVDFYCKDLMLAIEIDGDSHDHPEVAVKDITRQKRLEQLGVHVLRFCDEKVRNDIENVLWGIEGWIIEHEPTPNPSQEGEPTPNPSQEGKSTPNPSQEGKSTPNPSQEGKSTPNPSQEGEPTPNPSQEGEPTPNPSQEGNVPPLKGEMEERQ